MFEKSFCIAFLTLAMAGCKLQAERSQLGDRRSGGKDFIESCKHRFGDIVIITKPQIDDMVSLSCEKKFSRADKRLSFKYKELVNHRITSEEFSAIFRPKCPSDFELVNATFSANEKEAVVWSCRPRVASGDVTFKVKGKLNVDEIICMDGFKYVETSRRQARLDFLEEPIDASAIVTISHHIWSGDCTGSEPIK